MIGLGRLFFTILKKRRMSIETSVHHFATLHSRFANCPQFVSLFLLSALAFCVEMLLCWVSLVRNLFGGVCKFQRWIRFHSLSRFHWLHQYPKHVHRAQLIPVPVGRNSP